LPSFSPSNPIDDFVLFPEDSTSWNTDMSFPELEAQDLGQFNFDINDIDLIDHPSMIADHSFDFSFDRQLSSFQPDSSFSYTPIVSDQYVLDQWAEPQGFIPVSHTRPHPSGPTNDSGQLDANWQSGWLQADSLISPRTTTFADNYWPDGLVDHPQIPQNSAAANNSPLISEAPDWSLLESTMMTNSSSPAEETANNGPSQTSELRRSRKRRALDEPESGETFELLGQVNIISNSTGLGILDPSDPQQRAERQRASGISPAERLLAQGGSHFSAGSYRVSQEISTLQNACQLVSQSLNRVKGASTEYIALGDELRQLQGVLARLQPSQHIDTILSDSLITLIKTLSSQLQLVASRTKNLIRPDPSMQRVYSNLDPELRPDYLRELQVNARRLRSLCAIINNEDISKVESTAGDPQLRGEGFDNRLVNLFVNEFKREHTVDPQATGTNVSTSYFPTLTSDRNLQLLISQSESHDYEGHTQAIGSGFQIGDGSSTWQTSGSSSAASGLEASESVLQRANGNIETLDMYLGVDGVCSPTANGRKSVAAGVLTVRHVPRYSMLLKPKPSDLLPQGIEGSRLIERLEQPARDLVAGLDSNRLASPQSMSSPGEACRRILSSEQTRSRTHLQEEQTGGLATSQQGRTNNAMTSPDAIWHEDLPPTQNNSLDVPQYASMQEVLLSQSSIETSLQITASHQTSCVLPQAPPSGIFDTQYNFAVALVVLGLLTLTSNVWDPPYLSCVSPPPLHFLTFSRPSHQDLVSRPICHASSRFLLSSS
jgi:hypothetical protein